MLVLSSRKENIFNWFLFLSIACIIAVNISPSPLIERTQAIELNHLRPIEIIGEWSYGYVFDLFSPGYSKFKAVPNKELEKYWRAGKYWLLNTTPEYYIIFLNNHFNNSVYADYKLIYSNDGYKVDIRIFQPIR